VADGRVQTTAAATNLYEYALATRGGGAHLSAVAAVLGRFGPAVRSDTDETAGLPDAVTADVLAEVPRGLDQRL
jgi:starvation-inducible DNA-binding protein